jgi:hypothetical protein
VDVDTPRPGGIVKSTLLVLVESVQVVLEVVEPKVPLTVLGPDPLDAVIEALDELRELVGALLVTLADGTNEADVGVEVGDDAVEDCTVLLLLGDGLPVALPPLDSRGDGIGVGLVSSVLEAETLRLGDGIPMPLKEGAVPGPEWDEVELAPLTDVPLLDAVPIMAEEALRLGDGAPVPVQVRAVPEPG